MKNKLNSLKFSLQVLCRALGGKVGKAYTGWDIGLRKVRIVKDFSPCGFLDGLDEFPPSLSIIEVSLSVCVCILVSFSNNFKMTLCEDII